MAAVGPNGELGHRVQRLVERDYGRDLEQFGTVITLNARVSVLVPQMTWRLISVYVIQFATMDIIPGAIACVKQDGLEGAAIKVKLRPCIKGQ